MAGNLKLAVGLAAGYVLGARAGRERYERLAEAARQVAERPEIQQLAGKVRTRLGASMETATSAATDRLEQARRDMGSRDEPPAAADTITVEASHPEADEDAPMAEAVQDHRPSPPPAPSAPPRSGRRQQSRSGS